MPKGTLTRGPTAHVEDELTIRSAASGTLTREPTAHVSGELTQYGAGEP